MALGITNITQEDREKALSNLSRWPEQNAILTLFSLYHKYVSASPNNTKCPACKRVIKDFWQNYLK